MLNNTTQEMDRRQTLSKYMTKSTYDRMNDQQKRQLLEAWRMDKAINNKQIYAALELSQGDYYKELDRLGIVKKERMTAKKRQKLAGDPKKQISSCVISFSGDPAQLLDLIDQSKAAIKLDRQYRFKMEFEEIAEI
jgi:hypothetical protein